MDTAGAAAKSPIFELTAYIEQAVNRKLPQQASARARLHLLDTIAAMVSGAHLIAGRGAIKFIRTQGGPAQAQVIGSDFRTTAINAACANGMMGHADETDDQHLPTLNHPGCAIVPAALAVSELVGATGAQLLSAVALGYDVGIRVSYAMGVERFYEGYSMASYGGVFGAGAAAGGLLGLNAEQLRWVLSLCGQQAAGARSWQRDPNHMEKSFVLGGGPARNGVTSALMVQAGFNGVPDVFAGDHNYFAMHAPQADLSHLTRALGEVFEITNCTIKKHCVGGPIQAPLEGVTLLMEQGVKPGDITRLDVRIASHHASVVDNRDNPSICVQHILGLALVDGIVTFDSCHDMARLADPAVRRERAKVNLIYDTDMDKLSPRRPVDVVAVLRDGSTRDIKADAVKGMMWNPMNQQEVEAKAIGLIEPIFGAARARAICDAVAGLDGATEIKSLAALLAA